MRLHHVTLDEGCIPYLLESAFTKHLTVPLYVSKEIGMNLMYISDKMLEKMAHMIMENIILNKEKNIIDLLTWDSLYDKIQLEIERRV